MEKSAREGASLNIQFAACEKYALGNGWTVGGQYQDVMSGRRDDRPMYRELLARAKHLLLEGAAPIVVVAAHARSARTKAA